MEWSGSETFRGSTSPQLSTGSSSFTSATASVDVDRERWARGVVRAQLGTEDRVRSTCRTACPTCVCRLRSRQRSWLKAYGRVSPLLNTYSDTVVIRYYWAARTDVQRASHRLHARYHSRALGELALWIKGKLGHGRQCCQHALLLLQGERTAAQALTQAAVLAIMPATPNKQQQHGGQQTMRCTRCHVPRPTSHVLPRRPLRVAPSPSRAVCGGGGDSGARVRTGIQ